MPDCEICCEKLNKSNRSLVACENSICDFCCCKSCARTYLIGTLEDPHCMKCKGAWSDKFMVHNLNRSFVEKDYKVHRKNMLVERELSRLPDTMEYAGNQKIVEDEHLKLKENKRKIAELKKQIGQLRTTNAESYNTIHKISTGTYNSEKRKFIMACPNNTCRGYLSTQYKCDLCKLFTCPTCLEIVGYNKQDDHTCNPDNIASAEMIKKDTKPCPSCGVRIYKIVGCNQMWCTQCRIAFDYQTGRIDTTGHIHNYHYYHYLEEQQQNNQAIPRNPQDVLCGGLCSVFDLNRRIIHKLESVGAPYDARLCHVRAIHRAISHITYYTLVHVRQHLQGVEDNRDLRSDYILKKKTREQLAVQVYRKDNLRKKASELLHIYEVISVVGIEIFATLCNTLKRNGAFERECIEKVDQINQLRIYCNKEFQKISETYNNKVMCITDDWKLINQKYRKAAA